MNQELNRELVTIVIKKKKQLGQNLIITDLIANNLIGKIKILLTYNPIYYKQ